MRKEEISKNTVIQYKIPEPMNLNPFISLFTEFTIYTKQVICAHQSHMSIPHIVYISHMCTHT